MVFSKFVGSSRFVSRICGARGKSERVLQATLATRSRVKASLPDCRSCHLTAPASEHQRGGVRSAGCLAYSNPRQSRGLSTSWCGNVRVVDQQQLDKLQGFAAELRDGNAHACCWLKT